MRGTQLVGIDIYQQSESVFRLLDKDWMLYTAGDIGSFNTMTASWGAFGILWNKPVAIGFIRPQRFTHVFAERSDVFTFSFFSKNYRPVLSFCGSHSGRDTDKIKETGLVPVETDGGGVTFEQASLVFECKKLYAGNLQEENFIVKEIAQANYSAGDFHRFYIGEITGAWKRPDF